MVFGPSFPGKKSLKISVLEADSSHPRHDSTTSVRRVCFLPPLSSGSREVILLATLDNYLSTCEKSAMQSRSGIFPAQQIIAENGKRYVTAKPRRAWGDAPAGNVALQSYKAASWRHRKVRRKYFIK